MTSTVQMKILLKYHLNYAAGVYAEKEWMNDTGNAEVTFMDNAEDAVEVDKKAVEVITENAEAVDAYQEDARDVEEQGMIEMMRSLLPEENVMGAFVNDVAEAYTMNVSSSSNRKTAVRLPVIGNTAVTYEVIEKVQYKAVLTAWGEDRFHTPQSLSGSHQLGRDAICLSQGAEEDAACLNLRVMGEQSEMLTACLTKKAMEEQLYREEEDSSVYGVREEVLAELGEQFKVFPPTQRKKEYEVAEQQGVEKNIVKEMMKKEKTWQKQTSRFYQLPF